MSGFASKIPFIALIGSGFTSEVGLPVLLFPLGSKIVLRTACCSIGIGLPVYSTFKAIENRNENEQQKMVYLLGSLWFFQPCGGLTDKLIATRCWSKPFDRYIIAFFRIQVVRSHHGEISFVRSMIVKSLRSANESAQPRQQEGENTNREPEPSTVTNQDSEFDYKD